MHQWHTDTPSTRCHSDQSDISCLWDSKSRFTQRTLIRAPTYGPSIRMKCKSLVLFTYQCRLRHKQTNEKQWNTTKNIAVYFYMYVQISTHVHIHQFTHNFYPLLLHSLDLDRNWKWLKSSLSREEGVKWRFERITTNQTLCILRALHDGCRL